LDRLVVIDDVDSLYEDRRAVRLLKALCNTDEEKSIGWESATRHLDKEGIPRNFVTRSRLCLIANRWRSLNVNVQAIEDRGHVVYFAPTAAEIHRRVAEGKWFKDAEVFKFIGDHLNLIPQPSMRQYILAAEKKKAGMDWRRLTVSSWTEDESMMLLIELASDPKLKTTDARCKAFIKRGGGSRGTFFRKWKEYQDRTKGETLRLAN
jgi:hypothetical protein